jgi:hypothetical protein
MKAISSQCDSKQISSPHEDPEAEWMNENIQIGDVGSGLGYAGLWTGEGHLRTDPLGPTWAWKLA